MANRAFQCTVYYGKFQANRKSGREYYNKFPYSYHPTLIITNSWSILPLPSLPPLTGLFEANFIHYLKQISKKNHEVKTGRNGMKSESAAGSQYSSRWPRRNWTARTRATQTHSTPLREPPTNRVNLFLRWTRTCIRYKLRNQTSRNQCERTDSM